MRDIRVKESQVTFVARFLLTLLLVVLGGLLILWVTTLGITLLLTVVSPGWDEQPLSLLIPFGYGVFVTPLVEIVILGVLAHRRVRFTEFFLVLMCFMYVLAVAPEVVVRPLAEKYTNDWCPVWFATTPDYPVLVVMPGQTPGSYNSQVIPWSELPNFRKRNPSFSFLIPKKQYGALRAQSPREAYFRSDDLPNGRQDFYVSLEPPLVESRIDSRYEAEATQIYPRYVRTTQTYLAYRRGSWIVIIALDLGALAFYFSRRLKKPQLTSLS
jgi:hypothetical protein